MKIAVIDISNKIPLYDSAICEAIYNEINKDDSFVYLAPYNTYTIRKAWYKKLISLVPKSMSKKYSPLRKVMKCVESIINYLYLIVYLKVKHIDVAHFQWLPFLDYSSIEVYFLAVIKRFCPNIKVVFTNHNIIPHDFSEQATIEYKKRFAKVTKYIDSYIVHTETSKNEFTSIFAIDPGIIHVVHHGIFVSSYSPTKKEIDYNKIRVTMFGAQSYYKGTDIFIDSIGLLSECDRNKVDVTIIGPTPDTLYQKYGEQARDNGINWVNNWVTMDELQKTIDSSDIIVLPYRKISQSGVLLQALYFRKLIIASNLPSFKETLKGFDDNLFFENGNSKSLSSLLSLYINNRIDVDQQYKAIEKLNELYTWQKSAVNTLQVYKTKN